MQWCRDKILYRGAFSVYLHNAAINFKDSFIAGLALAVMIHTYDLIGPACATSSVTRKQLHSSSMRLLYRTKKSRVSQRVSRVSQRVSKLGRHLSV